MQAHVVAFADGTAHDLADVHGQLGARLLRVDDLDAIATRRLDHTVVTDLSTRFAVEGSLGNDDLYGASLAYLVLFAALSKQRRDVGLPFVGTIADEFGDVRTVRGQHLGAGATCLAAALALLVHAPGEALGIDADVVLAQNVLRHVEREAKGVVEFEGNRTGENRHARFAQRGLLLIEQRQALVEGLAETLLLGTQDLFDIGAALDDLRIGRTHRVDDGSADPTQDRFVESKMLGVAGGTAQDAA